MTEAITAISRYLHCNPSVVSNNLTLTELIELFNKNKSDEDFNLLKYYELIDEFFKQTTLKNNMEVPEVSGVINSPLGEWGNITLNQIYGSMSNVDIRALTEHIDLAVDALPALTTGVSAALLFRTFYRYNTNFYKEAMRSYQHSPSEQAKLLKLRYISFIGFSLVTLPFVLKYQYKFFSALRDSIILKIPLNIHTPLPSDSSTSGLLLFFANTFKNKKFLFLLFILLSILIYILYPVLIILPWGNYLNLYLSIIIPLFFLISIIHLYLLDIFKKNPEYEIPSILPNFLIKYLSEFKEISKIEGVFDTLKTYIYFFLCVLIICFLFFLFLF